MTVAEAAGDAMREAADKIVALRRQRDQLVALLERAIVIMQGTAAYMSLEREELATVASRVIAVVKVSDL